MEKHDQLHSCLKPLTRLQRFLFEANGINYQLSQVHKFSPSPIMMCMSADLMAA